MVIRPRCVRSGHKWSMYPLPVQFCVRWFCDGERAAPWVEPRVREGLERVIAQDMNQKHMNKRWWQR